MGRLLGLERDESCVALSLPLAFAILLVAYCLLPSVQRQPRLFWAIAGAGSALLVWAAALLAVSLRSRRHLAIEGALRPQHYVQACAHSAILLYWGWYWRQVYDSAYLIAAQILFAYAVDMLLTWSRRDVYSLGFGPFPIVFSTNLFLWFKDDWFAWQFLMIAVAMTAKACLRWEKDGRSAHIFNPSALALTLASSALLLTGASDTTWGREIAVTQFYPPHMYVFLFLVALPGQFLFGVTTMTLSAVTATYLFGLAYVALTGTYFFIDSYIPIAVFLGMHLLFTDPSTSPQSELGRLIFGAIYGLSVVLLYAVLARTGLPTFYDKLLQVPLMNLCIKPIDRIAQSAPLQRLDPARLVRGLAGRRRHLAYMSVWGMVFGVMSATQGVGDGHPGQWLPFWREACRDARPYACSYLSQFETTLCRAGSGWACNELGIRRAEDDANPIGAIASWQRGCDLGFEPACANAAGRTDTGAPRTAPPTRDDYAILLRGSKPPLTDRWLAALFARSVPNWASRHACGESPSPRSSCDLAASWLNSEPQHSHVGDRTVIGDVAEV